MRRPLWRILLHSVAKVANVNTPMFHTAPTRNALRKVANASVFLMAISFMGPGCLFRTKESVRIPLTNNAHGVTCHSGCLAQEANRKAYIACMMTCPGAVKQSRECSAQDLPPYAICEQEADADLPDYQEQPSTACRPLRGYHVPAVAAPTAPAPTAVRASR